jgi:hypothetical protein
MSPPAPCALCGNDQRNDVETILVRWVEPMNGSIWDDIPRCKDRPACRQRFQINAAAKAAETGEPSEPWPLHDSDWAQRLPLPDPADVVEPAPVEAPPALPQPEPEPPPAWAMSATFVDEPDEDMPWV